MTILPLDLEVQSRIGYRALTHGTDSLTPSANVLIEKIAEAAIANVAPDTPNRTKEVKNQMRAHFNRVLDSEWKSCVGGETSRRFFSSVFLPEAMITHQPSSMVCQVFTGHSYLLWAPEGDSERSEECPQGRAYKSRKKLYNDKITIVQKKVTSLFAQNRKPNTGMHFIKNWLFFKCFQIFFDDKPSL